jgi:hypothetical protein
MKYKSDKGQNYNIPLKLDNCNGILKKSRTFAASKGKMKGKSYGTGFFSIPNANFG